MSNNAQSGTRNPADGTRAATKMDAPQAMRDVAEKGAAHAKETYERMTAASNEVASGMNEALSTATQTAMACNAKALEFARINANATFDYASKLFAVKSPAEFIELSTQHARQQFEVLSGQSKEIAALSQKAMLEAAAPLKAGAAKMFKGPSA
jgi:phasin